MAEGFNMHGLNKITSDSNTYSYHEDQVEIENRYTGSEDDMKHSPLA